MVVRMRRNRSQSAKRRSHHGLTAARVTKDQSGSTHLRHRVNPETGMYRGRVVVDIVAAQKRSVRRDQRRTKELRASGQDTGQKENAET